MEPGHIATEMTPYTGVVLPVDGGTTAGTPATLLREIMAGRAGTKPT